MPEVPPVTRAVLEVREGRSDSFSLRGIVMAMREEGRKGGSQERREKCYTQHSALAVPQGPSWIHSIHLDLLLY